MVLDRIGTVHLAKRGRAVVNQGDTAEHVYRVVSGALRAVKLLPDGRRHVADFLLPGDFFGLTDFRHYGHSVEAVADTTLIRYPRRGFEAALETDPRVGRRFLRFVCDELSAAQERLLLLGRRSAMERLSAFLLAMADQEPEQSHRANRCTLPMTRVDIADYLGLTVETVSRLLSQLRARGVIDLPRPQEVVFLDRAALEDLGECGADNLD